MKSDLEIKLLYDFQEAFASSFSENFFWTQTNIFSAQDVQTFLNWGHQLDNEKLLKPAGIGKGVLKREEQEIRNDLIYWIDNFESTPGKLIKTFFHEVMALARIKLFLPSRRFECHFAKYPVGSFYKRHIDQHSKNPGRVLSLVIYLSDLQPGDGGELIIYDEDLRPITIRPQAGRVIVFDSSLEHEVRKSNKERWSITGWIREDLVSGLSL